MPFGKNDDDFEAFSRDSDAAPNRCTAGIVINRAGDDEEFATPFLAEMLDVLFQPQLWASVESVILWDDICGVKGCQVILWCACALFGADKMPTVESRVGVVAVEDRRVLRG